MESQPQNPEFRNNPESFHPCSLAMMLDNFLQGFLPVKTKKQPAQLKRPVRILKQVAQWATIAHLGASIMFGDTII